MFNKRNISTIYFISLAFAYTNAAHAALVGYYPLDGNANDYSGFNNHGLEHGGINYATGKVDQAAIFDGIDKHISVANAFSGQAEFSQTSWIYVDSQTGFGSIIHTASGGVYYNADSNQINLEIFHDRNGGEDNPIGTPSTRSHYIFSANLEDAWFHIAFVAHANNTADFYINGSSVLVGTQIIDNGITGKYASTNLGAGVNNANGVINSYLSGMLDDVGIYNHALTNAEVIDIYTSTVSTVPEPAAVWLFGTGILSLFGIGRLSRNPK